MISTGNDIPISGVTTPEDARERGAELHMLVLDTLLVPPASLTAASRSLCALASSSINASNAAPSRSHAWPKLRARRASRISISSASRRAMKRLSVKASSLREASNRAFPGTWSSRCWASCRSQRAICRRRDSFDPLLDWYAMLGGSLRGLTEQVYKEARCNTLWGNQFT